MKIKPNKIKVDFGSYRHYWRGEKKSGKSTAFRDIVREEYGDTKYGLLISTGNETGYKALDDVYAIEAISWPKLTEIINDLIKNKNDNDFKVVALDTIDELVAIAIQEAMDVHKKRTGKAGKSLNDIMGGYGAGRQYVTKLINEVITKLERAGFGLVFIGHCKLRDIKEKGESEPYQILTSNLEATYDNIFADKADIIATFVTEKIVKDKKIQEQNRYIVFRGDGYIDSGTRLAGMPDRVPLTAKDYLRAFHEGVMASKNEFSTPEELEKLKEEELAERLVEAEKFIKSYGQKEEETETESFFPDEEEDGLIPLEELKPMLNEKCSFLTRTGKKEKLMGILEKYAEGGNFNRIKDVQTLNKLWEEIKEFN